MAFVPVCVQCGTRSNPCRCKVLGPTVGFVAFVVAGVIEWPLGAASWRTRPPSSTRGSPAPSPSNSSSVPSPFSYSVTLQGCVARVLRCQSVRSQCVNPLFYIFLFFFSQ